MIKIIKNITAEYIVSKIDNTKIEYTINWLNDINIECIADRIINNNNVKITTSRVNNDMDIEPITNKTNNDIDMEPITIWVSNDINIGVNIGGLIS